VRRVGKGALAPCPPPIRKNERHELRVDGGHASLCPPYGLRRYGIPYRAVANLRNIFHQIMAAAFFTELLAATHPLRKSTRLAARKIACLQFAARLAGRVNVRRGGFWRTGLKRLTQLGISHRAARRSCAASPRHPAQVLQSATDFGYNETAGLVVILKRLRRRAFSQSSARFRPRLAFGLPQGA
jgi:hypothetical protein